MGFGDWFSDSIASPIYHGAGEVKDYLHRELIDPLTGKSAAAAADRAANLQAKGAADATSLQREIYEKNLALNEPWRQAGISSLSDLSAGIKSGEFNAPDGQYVDNSKGPGVFDESQYKDPAFKFNFEADPGYQFRKKQAQDAIERSAAAGGGFFSGATLSDIGGKIGQMASDEYGNAYSRARGAFENDRSALKDNRNFAYTKNRDLTTDAQNSRNFGYGVFSDAQDRKRTALNDRFSRLSTLAGFGGEGANRTQQAGTNFGDAASSNILGSANAQAAGIVGAANAQQQGMMGLAGLAAKIYGAS